MNKKLIGLVVASITGILFLNLTCEPPSEAETTGTINGTISDATTSQPISGAMITTNPVTSSKTTDSEGNFLIEGIEPGTYTIQASKDGYKTNSTTVSVVAGEESSADIQLAPLEPELAVSATSLNFGTSSTNLTFTITNSGIGTLTWSIVSTANWITVNPTSGSTEKESDVVTVTVNRTGMSYGNHYETITVASNTNSKTFDIIMTVPNPNSPQLSAYPVTLNFETSETEMTFYITNTGTGMLTWNITDDKPWISYSPNSGTTETEVDEIKVTVDRLGLSPGNYSGNIAVSSDGGNQNIVVSVTVLDEPLLSISPKTLDLGDTLTVLTFDVANAGTGDLNWSTSCNQAWITTSPTAGTNYGTVNVTVSRDGISPGDYSGTVTVSSNGGTGYVEIQMNIPADDPPSEVTLLSPTDITENSMTLNWTRNFDSDFAAYKVYRDLSPAVTQSSELIATITNSAENYYTDTGLQASTTYYYRVYVMDMVNQHTASNVVSTTTLSQLGNWSVIATLNYDLYGIDVLNENYVIAVGESGKIFYYNGTEWTEETSPTAYTINDVKIISQTDIWAVGSDIYHYDGINWSVAYDASTCYSIEEISANNIWVGGSSGNFFHYDGNSWSLTDVTSFNIRDLYFIDANNGWAVDSNGKVFYYNGVGWSLQHDVGISECNAIIAFGSSDIWLNGFDANSSGNNQYPHTLIYHWNGVEWDSKLVTAANQSSYVYKGTIAGSSSSDIWFGLRTGEIWHWDGNGMRRPNSPTSNDIHDMIMTSSTDGWAVGDNGVVLRYH